jgi:hypothetical protein
MRAVARWAKRIGIVVALVVAAAAVPIVWNETQCMQASAARAAYRPILDAPWRRSLADAYLAYPEWSIVHAYEDFAAVAKARGESAFGYASGIAGYWTRLCRLSGAASARAPVAIDMKAMLYIIGLSFTAEMAVKGAHETTVGALTEWASGGAPTPEDAFSRALNEDYARFLQQTPWYEYPFGAALVRFWRETPWRWDQPVRSAERRVALSMEYGVKSIYARAIGALAALSPADLRIRSVVSGLDAGDLAADPRISLIERRPDGTSVIETPRYRAFTDILKGLAGRGRNLIEIAGNDEAFVTALAPTTAAAQDPTARLLFTAPLQARPGWERRGLTIAVSQLAQWMRDAPGSAVALEHVYDY